MNITREKKKQEAIKRMKALGLISPCIEEFDRQKPLDAVKKGAKLILEKVDAIITAPVVQEEVKPVVQQVAPQKKVVDDSNREKYTATMEKSLRKRVKIAAATAGIQVSTFIEEACLEKLEREGL